MGHATRASASLYPHQWSWDSACIAIGYSRWDQSRAQAELRGTLRGAVGRRPPPAHPLRAERAATSRGPSSGRRSSRLTRPAIRRRRESSSRPCTQRRCGRSSVTRRTAKTRSAFSASSSRSWRPGTSTCTASARVTTTGSSRSGTRGSRAWTTRRCGTTPSRGSTPSPDEIPPYERVDVEFVDANERPTDDHYDRYAYLVKLYRDRNYEPERIRDDCPFVVRDVLFNSLLVQANRDLAEISRVVGADPEPFETWADRTRRRSGRASGTTARRRTSTSTFARRRTSRRAPAPASRPSMPGFRAATGSNACSRSSSGARSRSQGPAASSRAFRPTIRASIPRGTGAARCGR